MQSSFKQTFKQSHVAIHIKRLVTMKGNRRVCKTKGNLRITSVSYVVPGLLEELVSSDDNSHSGLVKAD